MDGKRQSPKHLENVIIIKCNCLYLFVVVKTAVALDYLRVFICNVFDLSLMMESGLLCLSAAVVQSEAVLQTAAQLL